MAWGATETIKSGGDWTTMSAFEGDHDGDTVTSGATTGLVSGVPADTGSLYWSGWQSGQSATEKVVLKADTGNETDGINDATGTKASIQDRMWIAEVTNPMYMDWLNMEFAGNNEHIRITADGGGVIRIAKCMFRDSSGSGIRADSIASALTVQIGGCLFKDITALYRAGIRIEDANVTCEIVNCTVVGCTDNSAVGFESTAGTVTAKNCAAGNNTLDFSGPTETTTASEDDGDIVMTDGVDFTSPSTDDYRVVASGALDGAGTSIVDSWFTSLVATDMQGTSWGGTPSVGCFEVEAVAGGGNARLIFLTGEM